MCGPYCYDCFYFSRTPHVGQRGTCDYILITDQMRGCPSGDGCVVKLERRVSGKLNTDKRKAIIEREKREKGARDEVEI